MKYLLAHLLGPWVTITGLLTEGGYSTLSHQILCFFCFMSLIPYLLLKLPLPWNITSSGVSTTIFQLVPFAEQKSTKIVPYQEEPKAPISLLVLMFNEERAYLSQTLS